MMEGGVVEEGEGSGRSWSTHMCTCFATLYIIGIDTHHSYFVHTIHILHTQFALHTSVVPLVPQLRNILMDTTRGFPAMQVATPNENSPPPTDNTTTTAAATGAADGPNPTAQAAEEKPQGQDVDMQDAPGESAAAGTTAGVAAPTAPAQPPTAAAPTAQTTTTTPAPIKLTEAQVASMVNEMVKHTRNLFRSVTTPDVIDISFNTIMISTPTKTNASSGKEGLTKTASGGAAGAADGGRAAFHSMWLAAQQPRATSAGGSSSNTQQQQPKGGVGHKKWGGTVKAVIGADLLGKPKDASQAYKSSVVNNSTTAPVTGDGAPGGGAPGGGAPATTAPVAVGGQAAAPLITTTHDATTQPQAANTADADRSVFEDAVMGPPQPTKVCCCSLVHMRMGCAVFDTCSHSCRIDVFGTKIPTTITNCPHKHASTLGLTHAAAAVYIILCSPCHHHCCSNTQAYCSSDFVGA